MIPKEDCIVGMTYEIKSRNLVVGVWTGEGFVGIREKFDSEFLFVEYHWDDGPPFGTAHAITPLAMCPMKDLSEAWTSDVCSQHLRLIEWRPDDPEKDQVPGANYHTDDNSRVERDDYPRRLENTPLFKWLEPWDKLINQRRADEFAAETS